MRTARIMAGLSAVALTAACNREEPIAPSAFLTPNADEIADESWVITAYKWEDAWIQFASWDGSYLPADLKIVFRAYNWEPEYPTFQVDFDNVYAFGDVDLTHGLVDDFNDGLIDPIWNVSTSPGADVYEAGGVLNIDITSRGDDFDVGSFSTDYVVHGEFDVRVDFALSPGFHSLTRRNAHLLVDGVSGFYAAVAITNWRYHAGEGKHGDYNINHAWAGTSDLVGKLRLTRTRAVIEVSIDIKPGSDPNSINPESNGVVPVAILGNDDFDVMDVDITTLKFGPDGASPAHDLSDAATYADHLQDVNNDGFTDLVSHHRQKETGLQPGDTEACITGATTGGTPIEGCDAVRVFAPGLP